MSPECTLDMYDLCELFSLGEHSFHNGLFYVFLNKENLSVSGPRCKPAGKSMAEITPAKHVVRFARQLNGVLSVAHTYILPQREWPAHLCPSLRRIW